ncbi:hypothetical protein [Clostridium felsineum]|uniref:hypothetical protein n=1 Tax=Clostridium felsineum TaxID=36839 RepID=UPI00098C8591|nr:hypothetical protein [Clostridium felsineum]URZ16885.1 hypothetical protein CLFE_029320 [Clostridium felsineum DSM 794]
MAVSKELKQFIEKEYDLKIKAVRAEYSEKLQQANSRYIEGLKKEYPFKELSIALTMLDIFREEYGLQYSYYNKYFIKDYAEMTQVFDGLEPPETQELMDIRDTEIAVLKKDKERLLIKLSLKKDFDEISKTLAQYGISL